MIRGVDGNISMENITNIYLASTSQEKVSAVQLAWAKAFPSAPVPTVSTYNVPSDVAPQPLNDAILQGAQNRLDNLLLATDVDGETTLTVSFESGIWLHQPTDERGDEGTICLVRYWHNDEWSEASTRSQGRSYPYFLVRQANAEGITELKQINARVKEWYAANPVYSPLTRIEAMAEAFHIVLLKILNKLQQKE